MSGLLQGITVIDFSRIVSGPFATQILGDLGAEIIKIERVDGGDDSRLYDVTDPSQAPGAPFLAVNRNKKSVALNVTKPDGRAVAERLLASADVAIHNFRTGVMERLGLGYETVSKINPRIVYCAISGYGSTGPLARRAANDLCVQGHSGLLSITGEPGRPPVRVPTSVCDITAGLYATIGILAALVKRQESGLGQAVETSMLGGQVNMLNHFLVEYWLNGTVPQPMGTANRMGLPNQAFPTKDGWMVMSSPNDRSWTRICQALGMEELATDERFATLPARYAHRQELVDAVSRGTQQFDTAECVARLDAAGVPCAPVQTIPEVAHDPQLEALGSIVEMPVEGKGNVKLVATPLKFSATPLSTHMPPPMLGEHTDEILMRVGYTKSEIACLRREGTIL